MRVFLDDERTTPSGWERTYWPVEVIALLTEGNVTELSLDHDLGDDERGTGYDVVLWIEEAVATRGYIPPKIFVHSANSSAREKMLAGIRAIESFSKKRLYNPTILDSDIPQLPEKGDRIIFLDFDGVLHPQPCRYQSDILCHLPRFEKILRDFPGINVVISSAWRQDESLEDLRSYFSSDIAVRIIDVTPTRQEAEHLFKRIGPYERQVEIEAWIEKSGQPVRWVAIDDRPHWFQPNFKNLVCCKTEVGLDDERGQELRIRLSLL